MKLRLVDILTTVIISVVFGIIYRLWGPFYDSLKVLGTNVEQLSYGMWFIAGTIAFLIVRKPGIALLAETAAASGEFIAGSQYGLEVLIYGVLQGLLAEFVFAAFKYKRTDIVVVSLAAIGSCIASLGMDAYKGYITELATWNLTTYIAFRMIGSVVLSGLLAVGIVRALDQTGVTRSLRPLTEQDMKL